jgi:hypothetical protein
MALDFYFYITIFNSRGSKSGDFFFDVRFFNSKGSMSGDFFFDVRFFNLGNNVPCLFTGYIPVTLNQ